MSFFTNDDITNEPITNYANTDDLREYIATDPDEEFSLLPVLNNNLISMERDMDGLLIKPLSEYAKSRYVGRCFDNTRDSGYDLYYCGETVTIEPFTSVRLNMGIACKRLIDHGYDLRARSSIDKTPLMLSNGIGTIDCDYRGEILASVRNVSPEPYTVEQGVRLFQLTFPQLQPFSVQLVDDLPITDRGTGGFGSTGTI